MPAPDAIQQKLSDLKELAPAGYALAMHVHFTAPTFLFQTYDRRWLDHYSQMGFVMTDPIVRWGFENRGYRFWCDFADEDPAGVLQAASDHGLKYGVVTSVGTEKTFSIGGFARGDRPFSEEEAENLYRSTGDVHEMTNNLKVLSPETADALRKLSIEVTHPE